MLTYDRFKEINYDKYLDLNELRRRYYLYKNDYYYNQALERHSYKSHSQLNENSGSGYSRIYSDGYVDDGYVI